jgi:hypothetical protein
LIVLRHLSDSNFVALRAALLPELYNFQLPPSAVLAALVVHASLSWPRLQINSMVVLVMTILLSAIGE